MERALDNEAEIRVTNEHLEFAFREVKQRGKKDRPSSLFNPQI
jgi:hypothetical protein